MTAASPTSARPDQHGLRYRRVILKLSGESVQGDAEYGIDHDVLEFMAC